MDLKYFENMVKEELCFGFEYSDEYTLTFAEDGGEPEGELTIWFGTHKYVMRLVIGYDKKPAIHTYDYDSISLSQESVFAWCLFEEQKRHEKELVEIDKLRAELASVKAENEKLTAERDAMSARLRELASLLMPYVESGELRLYGKAQQNYAQAAGEASKKCLDKPTANREPMDDSAAIKPE